MFSALKSWLAAQPTPTPARKSRLGMETLEPREVPAAGVSFLGTTMVVEGYDGFENRISVNRHSSGVGLGVTMSIRTGSGWSTSYVQYTQPVTELVLVGKDKADDLCNGLSLPSTIYGNGGSDTIYGGTGNDLIYGGAGDDVVSGFGGDDVILGQAGNDYLCGDGGHDRINGGAGVDTLHGAGGNDVLIAIDGGTSDWVDAGTGCDVIWVDRYSTASDSVTGAGADDAVQRVDQFANGPDRSLDGDRITDPAVKATDANGNPTGHTYRMFSGNPLFSAAGPRMDDVRQGAIGDCWMLATAAAVANDNPHAWRQRIVDFDDGTYGIRLGDKFYRVDNDLPVAGPYRTTPVYAQLGAGNSMWVAVLEKAYAHHRTGANSYPSLEGGSGEAASRAFGSTAAGTRWVGTYSSAAAMANDIFARWNNYEAVTLATGDSRYQKYLPFGLINSHQYTVAWVTVHSTGVVQSITLRNPWGIDTDAWGDVRDGSNDGYITLTPDQLFTLGFWVQWGKV